MTESKTLKVAILGAGPAGYTAAIYTARANLEPMLFTGMQPGGQLTITNDIENFPGFANGINGPELMEIMRAQAERFGTRIVYSPVDEVDLSVRPFRFSAMGEHYTAETLIIATGATAKYLGLPTETAFQGRGVSACATCDGPFYRDRVVAVIGGGDSAMEEATHLTKFASKVYLIHRRNEFRASRIMQERALNNPKVEVIYNAIPVEVLGDEAGVTGCRLKDTVSGELRDLACDGFFLAIGHTPNTDIFKGKLDLDAKGYIVTRPGSSRTSVEGVFACGDVQDSTYRQAITAAGSGCMAALDAERWLIEKGE